jgi:hypothetical protein
MRKGPSTELQVLLQLRQYFYVCTRHHTVSVSGMNGPVGTSQDFIYTYTYIRMYVCMHACMYVCMYVYM